MNKKGIGTSAIHDLLKSRLKQEGKLHWYNTNKTIHLSCKMGFLNDVIEFLSKYPNLLLQNDEYSRTPLYYATLCGHSHVTEYLLSKGAYDINQVCRISALKEVDRDLMETCKRFGGYNSVPTHLLDMIHTKQKLTMVRKLPTYKKTKKKKKDFSEMTFYQIINKVFDSKIKEKMEVLMLEDLESKDESELVEKERKKVEFYKNKEEKKVLNEFKSPLILLQNALTSSDPFMKSNEGKKYLSDCVIEYQFLDKSKQVFNCHLFLLLTKWDYFREKYFNISEKMKENKEKDVNQLIFEEIFKLKQLEKIIIKENERDTFTCDYFEAVLKALYTGNIKVFSRLERNDKDFRKITKKYRVNEECLKTRLFTTKSILESIKAKKEVNDELIREIMIFQLSDCKIICKDEEFYCQKFILCNRVHFFSMSFLGPFENTSEIKFEFESVECISLLIDFIYYEKIKIVSLRVAIELILLSQKFLLNNLYKKCKKFIVESIEVNNIIEILFFSQKYDLTSIYKICFKKVVNYLVDNEFLWKKFKPELDNFGMKYENIKGSYDIQKDDYAQMELDKVEKIELSEDFLTVAIHNGNESKVRFFLDLYGKKIDYNEFFKNSGEFPTSFLKYIFSYDHFKFTKKFFEKALKNKKYQIIEYFISKKNKLVSRFYTEEELCDLAVEKYSFSMLEILEDCHVDLSSIIKFKTIMKCIKNSNDHVFKYYEGSLISEDIKEMKKVLTFIVKKFRTRNPPIDKNSVVENFLREILSIFEKNLDFSFRKSKEKRNFVRYFWKKVNNFLNKTFRVLQKRFLYLQKEF